MFRNLNPSALGISGRQSETIESALSFGFKGIDLDLPEFEQAVKLHGLAHARRLIDSARLKLGTFRLPIDWDDENGQSKSGLDELAAVAQQASSIGLTRAITTIAPANDLRPYPENFEFHRRRLTELGTALAEKGLKLGLEFSIDPVQRSNRAFQFIHTFDALATLVGMVRSPNVGIVADLFTMHISGAGVEDLRKLGGERIVSVVISDAPADKPAADCTPADRLLPGETGTIDLAGALNALAELGYDGPITPAAAPEALRGIKRDQLIKLAGDRLTQAWTAAGLTPAGKLAPGKLASAHP